MSDELDWIKRRITDLEKYVNDNKFNETIEKFRYASNSSEKHMLEVSKLKDEISMLESTVEVYQSRGADKEVERLEHKLVRLQNNSFREVEGLKQDLHVKSKVIENLKEDVSHFGRELKAAFESVRSKDNHIQDLVCQIKNLGERIESATSKDKEIKDLKENVKKLEFEAFREYCVWTKEDSEFYGAEKYYVQCEDKKIIMQGSPRNDKCCSQCGKTLVLFTKKT